MEFMMSPSNDTPRSNLDDLLNVKQVAELMACSTKTVYRLIQSGELPAAKVRSVWRVSRHAVHTYLSRSNESQPHDPS